MQAFLLYTARLAPAGPQSAPCGPQISLLRDRKPQNWAQKSEKPPLRDRKLLNRARKPENSPLRARKLHNRARKPPVLCMREKAVAMSRNRAAEWCGTTGRYTGIGRQGGRAAVAELGSKQGSGGGTGRAVVRRDWVTEREGQQWRRAGNGRRARAAWRRRAGNGRYAGKSLGSWGERGVVFLSTIHYICNMR